MSRKTMALAVATAAALLAACAGRYGSNTATDSSSFTLPNMPDFKITATYPNNAGTGKIMEELPGEGLGTVNDPFWKATLGGYTQQTFSQALGFAPGTKLTIMNISKSISHTLNVVKKIKGPPAKFPGSPVLSMNPSGGKLQKGYASGVISPGKSVSVTLGKAGIYLIGCFFHYSEGMHDVLVVHKGATPGPQGTAPAH
jgi:plastocyanin